MPRSLYETHGDENKLKNTIRNSKLSLLGVLVLDDGRQLLQVADENELAAGEERAETRGEQDLAGLVHYAIVELDLAENGVANARARCSYQLLTHTHKHSTCM